MTVAAISSPKELHVDLEATTDLDVTAVQLLCCAARGAGKVGTCFGVLHLPEGVRTSVREMGFDDFPAPAMSADAEEQ